MASAREPNSDALRDPTNHDAVIAVIRREARRDPEWINRILRRQARIEGTSLDQLFGRC